MPSQSRAHLPVEKCGDSSPIVRAYEKSKVLVFIGYCIVKINIYKKEYEQTARTPLLINLTYAIASAGAFSGSQPVKPSSGIAAIVAISSAESSKSKICVFSRILEGVTDLVSTLSPD